MSHGELLHPTHKAFPACFAHSHFEAMVGRPSFHCWVLVKQHLLSYSFVGSSINREHLAQHRDAGTGGLLHTHSEEVVWLPRMGTMVT